MYICLECKKLFEEPKECCGEQLEYLGTLCREMWSGCPYCNGDYMKAFKCNVCSNYIKGKYIEILDDNIICENCYIKRDICKN